MQLHVKGKNLEVNESIRSYAERKLRKLDRQLRDSDTVEVELAVEHNPRIAESQVAEATVHVKGRTLRARKTASDMRAAIDELTDKLVRQVKDGRKKRVSRRRHGAGAGSVVGGADDARPTDRNPSGVSGPALEDAVDENITES